LVGNTYRLTFNQSPEVNSSQFNYFVDVTMTPQGGPSSATRFQSPITNTGDEWADWFPQQLDFLATASTISFRFNGANPPNGGINVESGIDNLALADLATTAVPEPATLVLLGLPLVVLGALTRRRA
jgi:hypothetical protein